MAEPIRLLIVDDSRCFRSVIEEALSDEPDIVVIGSVFSGEKALELIDRDPPHLVTLDVEMPGLNGLETLQAIQERNARLPAGKEVGVLMVSGLTRSGVDITLQALSMGAFDFLTKPSGDCYTSCLDQLRQELTHKIRSFQNKRRLMHPISNLESAEARYKSTPHSASPQTAPPRLLRPTTPPSRRAVRAILIASSTGGPRALNDLLPDLCRRIDLPILIVQHMPPVFTASLAEQFQRHLGRTVQEAGDQEPIRAQHVYIAPGGRHLVLRCCHGVLYTGLTDEPPENHCRPSADPLFRTAAAALGADAIAVVLTGMGNDGTAGLAPLKRAGAHVIVQDEATSVVWGMPGSVVAAGLADEVRPLNQIAQAVEQVVRRRTR